MQVIERFACARPGRRRIDDEHCVPGAAESRGDEQGAQADIPLARERWDAQHVELRGGLQREQAGARGCRADDIVVGERPAIVAVRVAGRVAHGHTPGASA